MNNYSLAMLVHIVRCTDDEQFRQEALQEIKRRGQDYDDLVIQFFKD